MKFPIEVLRKCWFLAGPTACGKTAVSLELAERLNGEIVSLDSMAIYRGMDIGTAKPDAEQLQRAPHHLIDVVDPHEEFSTAEYMTAALVSCEEILERNRIPIFVGGTGLYLRAVLRGVFEGPPADWEFRHQLEADAAIHEPDWLHQQLQQVDPVSAVRLHPNDSRRLIRALEIYHLAGTPASILQQEHPLSEADRPAHIYWLHPPRDWLAERINRRVDLMFEQGLEQEVRALLEAVPPLGRSARQALGYRELIDWLEGRLGSREEAHLLIQTGTRQFAKRQHTWFRNLAECYEVMISGTESPTALAEKLQAYRS